MTQRKEEVKDTLRRTEVDIEQILAQTNLGRDNTGDSYYRNHWNTAYAQGGGRYEDYAPAYQYGSALANNEQYRGQRWPEMESNVRRDWESKNPGSAWDNFKGAIRHGWEKVTS